MKLKLILTMIVILGFISSGNVFATRYDYSDAAGYSIAKHSTPNWQRLGTVWNNEDSPLSEDTSDDGVSWSIDGGSTYGYGDIVAGQAVTFKFDIYKELWGRHQTEQLSVWFDWNQDSDFDDIGENIFQTSWDFRADYPSSPYDDSFAGVSESFFYSLIAPDDALGDYWLRARVACSFDIPLLDDFNPTGHVWQGEVEDWKLTVVPSTVPEPSTFILLGSGLVGLGFYAKKRKKA